MLQPFYSTFTDHCRGEIRLRSTICGDFIVFLCLLEYEINLKHLAQSLGYETATDAGDGSIFLGLYERHWGSWSLLSFSQQSNLKWWYQRGSQKGI